MTEPVSVQKSLPLPWPPRVVDVDKWFLRVEIVAPEEKRRGGKLFGTYEEADAATGTDVLRLPGSFGVANVRFGKRLIVDFELAPRDHITATVPVLIGDDLDFDVAGVYETYGTLVGWVAIKVTSDLDDDGPRPRARLFGTEAEAIAAPDRLVVRRTIGAPQPVAALHPDGQQIVAFRVVVAERAEDVVEDSVEESTVVVDRPTEGQIVSVLRLPFDPESIAAFVHSPEGETPRMHIVTPRPRRQTPRRAAADLRTASERLGIPIVRAAPLTERGR